LLTCGILAGALYVAMTLFVGMLWEGYSTADQTISELSAVGAPTRPLWMVLGALYTALLIVLGWIVWAASSANRPQRVVGLLLMIHGAFGFFWPPMNQRAVLAASGPTLSDTPHIVWAIVTGLLFLFETSFGAAAFGRRFRVYSIATIAIVLACGAITGTYTSRMQADLPTPWVGVWERLSSTAYMLWIAVLAAVLLRTEQRRIARPHESRASRYARAPMHRVRARRLIPIPEEDGNLMSDARLKSCRDHDMSCRATHPLGALGRKAYGIPIALPSFG